MPEALLVISPFGEYVPGDQIFDPDTIAAILASGARVYVLSIDLTTSTSPGLSVGVGWAVAGQQMLLQGGAFNYTPSGLQFSVDGGVTWSAVTNLTVTGAAWSGAGPTYGGTYSGEIFVRDASDTTIVSDPCAFAVANPETAINISAVTVGTVTTLAAGQPATFGATIEGGTLTFDAGIPIGPSGTGGVSIVAYGATQGGADCTAALNSAITAAAAIGSEVVIPGGDWWFASSVSISGAPIAIRGQGKGITRLHFSHTGIGLDIAPGNLARRTVLRDMSFYAENGTGQTAAALRITYGATSSFGYVTTELTGLEFYGYSNSGNGTSPFPQTFTRGVILNGCWSSRLDGLSWFGPPSAAGATTSAMVEINGSNDTRITSPQAYYGAALVIQTGYCEGLYLINPLVVGCDYVFKQTALTGWTGYVSGKTSLLGFWCVGGELNTALGHMQANMLIDGFLADCDITRDTGPSTAQVLFNFTDVSRFHFGPCDWTGNPGGADIAIQFQAVLNSSGCSLIGGHMENMGTAIDIVGGNGTVALMVTDVDTGGAAITDGSAITSGNRICVRGHASSAYPSGQVNPRDWVWQGLDNSVLLRVKSLQGGTDYLYTVPASSAGNSYVTLSTYNGAPVRVPTRLIMDASNGNGWFARVVAAGLGAAGTNQATATVIAAQVNTFTNVTTGAGAVLPGGLPPGTEAVVFNRSGTSLLLYPQSGGAIESHPVNQAVSLADGTATRFTLESANQWRQG